MSDAPADSREHWGSGLGFLLAASGGAIGLGNLWAFPYRVSAHGGAAFVLAYLAVVVLVALPLLLAELVIGRHSGESPVLALVRLGGERWRWLGYVFVANAGLILSFYSVVTGWTLLSLGQCLMRGVPADPQAFFARISHGPEAVLGHLLAMALTALVIGAGVRTGIERLSLLAMPLLLLLLLVLAVRVAGLEGADAGYRFYLQPQLSELLRWRTFTEAAGQAFFSLSLGMGSLITYASYLRGRENLMALAGGIALADTAVALLGGLVTFPLLAHAGLLMGLDGAAGGGSGTLFVAIPAGLAGLGAAGRLLACLFFLVLAIAALLTAVSHLEVVAAGLIDRLGWSRARAGWLAGLAVTLCGLPPALDNRWIDVLHGLFGQISLLFVGLMIALLLGWLHPDPGRLELALAFPAGADAWPVLWWRRLLRFLAPPMLGLLLVRSLFQLPGVLRPLFPS